MGKGKVTRGDIKREVGASNLETSNLRGGRSFPIRYGSVTRVDPKRMVVDLTMLGQTSVPFTNVAITFPGAGSRHFFGAMPEVGDMCLLGQQPAESGRSKRPVILGWYVPSTQAGYDWLNVRSHGPEELDLTPKQKVALEGNASERRHKLRQMEPGNIVASSSQGSDLMLTESATLSNRRGNEIILRDQDQALVVRSLQQFHAGAGFRSYSGMVQRDANLLPTQVVKAAVDWASDRQVDETGAPLPPSALDENGDETGTSNLAGVFDTGIVTQGVTNPSDVLKLGLFIDPSGNFTVQASDAVYGGKPMYRVSRDIGLNAVTAAGTQTFTEYRVEVAHTSTGILPVTEQTDGIDIDRLLLIRAYDPKSDTLQDQLAFLVRSRDPEDPSKESFIALSKGGAWLTSFQGQGSKVSQENLRTGKVSFYGADADGNSRILNASGAVAISATTGRPSDNVGVEIKSESGAVEIYGGGPNSEGGADGSPNPNSPSNSKTALSLRSANGAILGAAEQVKIAAPEINLTENKVTNISASSAFNVNAGDTISMSSKASNTTINGKAEYTYGGPLDGLATNGANGPLRSQATPPRALWELL